ncbi:TerD family protein [Actinoplanes sp. NPDC051470]|uniref:TerD family protein n=1 Tax=Actinoplanes sp. NPDC051470 TaxID=3157224 RepID=UPI00341E7633
MNELRLGRVVVVVATLELVRWSSAHEPPARRLAVTVHGPPGVALSALLFRRTTTAEVPAGIVRASQVPGARSRRPAGGQPWRLDLDLDWLPTEVARVVIAADLPAGGPPFGKLPAPVVRLADHRGVPVAEYAMTWLTTEYAVVTVELHRVDGRWRMRTGSDGYADGLAGLAAAHHVDELPDADRADDASAIRRAVARILGRAPAPAGDRIDAATVTAYRHVQDRLAEVPEGHHPAYLHLAARCTGAGALADAVAATGRRLAWRTDWAAWRSPLPDTTLYGPVGHVGALACGEADGRMVAAAVAHGVSVSGVHVWDAATGAPLGFDQAGHLGPDADNVLAIAFAEHAGRTVILTGDLTGTLRMWDAGGGAPVGDPLIGHRAPVRALAVGHIDGRPVVVSGAADGTLRRWDVAAWRPVGDPITGHAGRVRALAAGALGGRPVAVSGGDDGMVRVWDLATGQPVGQPTRHDGPVCALAFGVTAGRPVIVSADGPLVRIHHADTGQPAGRPLTGHTDAVLALALTEAGGRPVVVTGGADATLRLWDPTTGAALREPVRHTAPVTSLAVGRVGERTVVVHGRDAVRRIDLEALVEPAASATHTGEVYAVAYGMRHGRVFLATGGQDRTVRVLDPDTGVPLAPPLTGHDDAVLDVRFELVSGVPALLTGGADGQRAWDPDSLREAGDPDTNWQPTGTNCQLPDGRQLYAFGLPDFGVAVFDMNRRAALHGPLRGHTAPIRAMAPGPVRGRIAIATGSDDNTIRLWDVLSGEPIGEPLVGHLGPVWGLSFGALPAPNGLLWILASASSDGTVRLWDPDTGGPAHTTEDDALRAAGYDLPRRIDLGAPAYGVACAPPPGPPRLAVVTAAGTVAIRVPDGTEVGRTA